MISKRIPSEASDLAMVLMCIVLSVAENYIRIDAVLQRFKPSFDLSTLLGEEAVSKAHDLDLRTLGCSQKIARGGLCFSFAFIGTAEHTPLNVKANALVQPA